MCVWLCIHNNVVIKINSNIIITLQIKEYMFYILWRFLKSRQTFTTFFLIDNRVKLLVLVCLRLWVLKFWNNNNNLNIICLTDQHWLWTKRRRSSASSCQIAQNRKVVSGRPSTGWCWWERAKGKRTRPYSLSVRHWFAVCTRSLWSGRQVRNWPNKDSSLWSSI